MRNLKLLTSVKITGSVAMSNCEFFFGFTCTPMRNLAVVG